MRNKDSVSWSLRSSNLASGVIGEPIVAIPEHTKKATPEPPIASTSPLVSPEPTARSASPSKVFWRSWSPRRCHFGVPPLYHPKAS